MSVTKSALIRYKLLDKYFRNPYKTFYFDTLLETINDDLYEITRDGKGIQTRQLRDDIAFMRSSEGWSIELADLRDGRKKIYRYEDLNFSINNSPLNEIEVEQFQAAIQVLSQFEGMPQFKGIQTIIAKLKTDLKITCNEKPFVGFDTAHKLKGIEHLSTLYHAVQNKTPLEITYKEFKSEVPETYILHPYYLKEYNNRWFLYGKHQEKGICDWNVAIDRIVTVAVTTETFIENVKIDWSVYFSDIVGVTKYKDVLPEEVVLHYNAETGKYIENKTLHETQCQEWLNADTFEVRIKVILNYELEQMILGYSDSVEVIAPEVLRQKIASRLAKGLALY